MALFDFTISVIFLVFTSVCVKTILCITDADLFPYRESAGCTRFYFQDDGSREVRFSSPFTIFNRSRSSMIINGNGVTAFGASNNEISIPHTAQCQGQLIRYDHQKIMAFWSDSYEKDNAALTYMETSRAPLLQKAKQDITKAFPALNESELDVSWLFIVTWRNIPQCCSESDSTRQNTFQLVLAKSATRSFVLLYYTKIEWFNLHWAAGFDFGNSRRQYLINGSCTSNYQIITRTSNIGENGKWVFGVESDLKLPDTGIEDKKSQDAEVSLKIQPRVVSIMGNVPIFIQGPKMDTEAKNVTITCVFHDPSLIRPSETVGFLLPATNSEEQHIICQVPFLYSLGRMEINLRVKYQSRRITSMYQGYIFVVKEHEVGPLPVINLNTTQGSSFSASWNKSSIVANYMRIDTPFGTRGHYIRHIPYLIRNLGLIQIVLLEYKRSSWRELGPVTQSFPNRGYYSGPLNMTIFSELLKSSSGMPYPRTFALKSTYTLGSGIIIHKLLPFSTLLATDMIISQQQITNPIPVGNSTGNIYDRFCKTWYEKEPHPPMHLDTLPCPRTTEQAQFDWRFAPDTASISELEIYNPGAATSFIQKVPSPSGAASQCTYDLHGRLLISIPGAGRLLRKSPNNRRDTWAHYVQDTLPYVYCCRWGALKESNCISFYNKRPSNDGSNYVPPQASRATGLSNIVTFNGFNFTVAGDGEFWAIKHSSSEDFDDGFSVDFEDFDLHVHHSNEFKMQVRLQPYHSFQTNKTFELASIITAAVMEDTTDDQEVNVQVSLNRPHISVIVDGQEENILGLANAAPFNLYYDGVTISIQSRNHVIASFASGFSVLFLTSGSNDSSLNIVATHSSNGAKISKGLLGDFDSSFGRNLESQNRSASDAAKNTSSNSSEIFEWMVKQNESLFYYPEGKSHADYNPKQNKFGINEIELEPYRDAPQVEFCKGVHECNYDYLVTNSTSISEAGKDAITVYEQVFNSSSFHVHQCKLPNDLEHGHFKASSLVVGSTISISCNPGYKLLSEEITFTCQYLNSSMFGENVSWMNGNSSMPSLNCIPEKDDVTELYHEDSSTMTLDTSEETTEVADVTGVLIQSLSAQDEPSGSESNSSLLIVFICIVIGLVCVTVFGVVIAKCDRFRPARTYIVNSFSLRRRGDFELIRYQT